MCKALAKPIGKLAFTNRASGRLEHDLDGIARVALEPEIVVGKEQAGSDPGRALVAVREAVVLSQAEGIGCRERCGIGVAVCCQIDGPGQSGIYGSEIADAVHAAVFRNLAVVNR